MSHQEPIALVVDDDPTVRQLVRTALELEGVVVVEATSIAEAKAFEGHVDAVVLDRELPDGDGLDHYSDLASWFGAPVVLHSNQQVPPGYPAVEKGDVASLLDLLGLESRGSMPVTAHELARVRADVVIAEWTELCRWDPAGPPESAPPAADAVVDAVADALERPQPLGWGLDPALEPLADTYVRQAGSIEEALSQLVCLREAFARVVVQQLPLVDQPEASQRLSMIVERLMSEVARAGSVQLQAMAFSDPLTGLFNRRAFEADLRAEVSRAIRHDRPLTLVALDLDGLKSINDRIGHAAGDAALRTLAEALRAMLRAEDRAYRIGGDEFALLLPDTVLLPGADVLAERLRAAHAPPCAIGVAAYPHDPPYELLATADARLYQRRRDLRTGAELL